MTHVTRVVHNDSVLSFRVQVRYAVDKILSFRDSGGREEFFIQWSGSYRASWEPAEIIRKDCPTLVKEYLR